ncbi:MAG: YciI-like protein [Bacteroidales bacterium]|nr:YciI-like protein [Bacteroidales bacterium]
MRPSTEETSPSSQRCSGTLLLIPANALLSAIEEKKGHAVACHLHKKDHIMYYILFYKTVENYVELRAPFRPDHLGLVEEFHSDGRLVMAGALAEPADGAVLIFRGDTPQAAHDFVSRDPYVKNGLITEWSVRPWNVVTG